MHTQIYTPSKEKDELQVGDIGGALASEFWVDYNAGEILSSEL